MKMNVHTSVSQDGVVCELGVADIVFLTTGVSSELWSHRPLRFVAGFKVSPFACATGFNVPSFAFSNNFFLSCKIHVHRHHILKIHDKMKMSVL